MVTFHTHGTSPAHAYIVKFLLYVTGPAKRDQVGTKYIISQNGIYLELRVQYLLSVRCKMLPLKVFMYGKIFTYIDLADH